MKVRLPNGLSIHAPNRIDARFLYHEIFVQNCYLRHGVELREGATIFDVGANIGMFDVFLARTLHDFTLFAFEPIPQTFELLRRNTDPFADRVRLFNVGLSDHDGEATFTRFPRASALATCSPGHIAGLRAGRNELIARGGPRKAGASGRRLRDWPRSALAKLLDLYFFSGRETVRCRLRTLGDILKLENVDSIDLLKIDVENSEWEVLAGIDDAGWARIRQVVLEVHDIDGRLARILELLARHGFKVVADQEDWSREFGVFNVYARRDPDPVGSRRPQAAIRTAG
ncbi:FkbM family methyltransferase [Planctomyces sp. SH-PL62]|uniref:FkbM family methyltransferase n=1 Tax=Planctomyces sp. SH-PL62 TaxID=1636152 RepID=UPI00078BB600|nr:FkbM family methyltransferase [Planctomyces sp. SH-PL62]AMV36058.1 31-O-demethyl-FK506 methyltransferase FkbM [Planctomyces sp. SH-PL62]